MPRKVGGGCSPTSRAEPQTSRTEPTHDLTTVDLGRTSGENRIAKFFGYVVVIALEQPPVEPNGISKRLKFVD